MQTAAESGLRQTTVCSCHRRCKSQKINVLSSAKSGRSPVRSSNYFQRQWEPVRGQAREHLGWILVRFLVTFWKISVPARVWRQGAQHWSCCNYWHQFSPISQPSTLWFWSKFPKRKLAPTSLSLQWGLDADFHSSHPQPQNSWNSSVSHRPEPDVPGPSMVPRRHPSSLRVLGQNRPWLMLQ